MDENSAVGCCDGIKGDEVYGWAWWPNHPDRTAIVEILVDDRLVGTAVADVYRADLRAAGIGHGRYGFRYPAPRPGARERLRIEVRVQDGSTLNGGTFERSNTIDPENATSATFVRDALSSGDAPPPLRERTPPAIRFLVYSAASIDNRILGAPEYSYGFVARAFVPLLEQLGSVENTDGPMENVDRLVDAAMERAEAVVLLSFAPPHRTPLGLRCPTIPVVAWEYPTIPSRMWAAEPRNDWSYVLRQTGRAITLCHESTAAFRAALGKDYPVVTVPTPVWDRLSDLHDIAGPEPATSIEIDGFVFDTSEHEFSALDTIPSAPGLRQGEGGALPAVLSLQGVVFTTVLAPKDGRKNWRDIIAAFITAHRDHADATLVVKMIGADPTIWWYELHELIGRQAAYSCRVVILQGYLDEHNYRHLIRATHWIVNASRCEGQCLPLLEFMSAGRPAVAPSHTAMSDYISDRNALIVASTEEYCAFPHDPSNELTTTRHRIDWMSLCRKLGEAYAMSVDTPDRYRRLGAASRDTVRDYCSDEIVAATLDGFLGLQSGSSGNAAVPSRVLRKEVA